jgi:hypothetical protein
VAKKITLIDIKDLNYHFTSVFELLRYQPDPDKPSVPKFQDSGTDMTRLENHESRPYKLEDFDSCKLYYSLITSNTSRGESAYIWRDGDQLYVLSGIRSIDEDFLFSIKFHQPDLSWTIIMKMAIL